MMLNRPVLHSIALMFCLASSASAASSSSLEREYQQVRTIALRDPRVQAAYRDADRRLEAKILQIDPALKPYVEQKQGAKAPVQTSRFTKTPPPPETKVAPRKTPPARKTHTVATGETLGAIAGKYRTTVPALKAANHIKDERKLGVGQVLTIPEAK